MPRPCEDLPCFFPFTPVKRFHFLVSFRPLMPYPLRTPVLVRLLDGERCGVQATLRVVGV